MLPRDADATRQRLIHAAGAEFAQYGIAGARVDRIAANAQANKAQIYHYFGSKHRLFDAVWQNLVEQIVAATPLDVRDLPDFAARLSQTYAEHPDLIRLITWQRLARGDDLPHSYAVTRIQPDIDAIAKAQRDGVLSDRLDPGVLYALILHMAALWGMTSPDVLAAIRVDDPDQRREIVKSAVAALLS